MCQRPELHLISRGTSRYGELLAFMASWAALKRDGIPSGQNYGYEDNTLMQNLMSHGLWFDDAHGTSWFLPWHREYLYRVEKLLIDKWLEIRGNPSILKSLGWPAKDNGVIYSNEWYNDGLISYIRNPENICLRMPYWHWPKDEGRSPYDDLETGVPMAPFDSNTFGGSGSGNAGVVQDGFFSNQIQLLLNRMF